MLLYRFLLIFCFFLFTKELFAQHQNLRNLKEFTFKQTESKVLPGKSTEKKKEYNCSGNQYEDDKIGSMILITMLYQNGCYTDGRYNHNNYKVEYGKVNNYEAYKVYEPQSKASQFLGSQQIIHYKFRDKKDYSIYQLEGKKVSKIAEIKSSKITPGSYVKINALSVSKIKGNITYFFAPSDDDISTFNTLSPNVKAAKLPSNSLGNLYKYIFKVNGKPFDVKTDFNSGPASHANVYSHVRNYFHIKTSASNQGIIWQDQKTKTINLSLTSKDYKSIKNITLSNKSLHDLAAATYDNNNFIYYVTIEAGSKSTKEFTIYKADQSGKVKATKKIDASKKGLNITSFGKDNVASLKYQNGFLGMMLGRTMHKSSDGLNHQGGIAILLNAKDLSLIKNFGQTSGHSFENILTVNSSNQFLGIDLGDNYPRGINLHKFDQNGITSKVVYTFKTLHGTVARSPAGKRYPLYNAISRGSKKFYQWSNDNHTYTELGGIIENDNGYMVIFAGESSPNGKALDGSRVGGKLNDSRNIGLVQVIKDFEKVNTRGNIVSDDLVISKGITEKGGFYTFGGDWQEQRNAGVVWITKYNNKESENVSRLKSIKLSNDNVLLIWEKWDPDKYLNTYACKISEKGKLISEIVSLGTQVRLDRRDDIWSDGNQIFIASGDGVLNTLELVIFEIK